MIAGAEAAGSAAERAEPVDLACLAATPNALAPHDRRFRVADLGA